MQIEADKQLLKKAPHIRTQLKEYKQVHGLMDCHIGYLIGRTSETMIGLFLDSTSEIGWNAHRLLPKAVKYCERLNEFGLASIVVSFTHPSPDQSLGLVFNQPLPGVILFTEVKTTCPIRFNVGMDLTGNYMLRQIKDKDNNIVYDVTTMSVLAKTMQTCRQMLVKEYEFVFLRIVGPSENKAIGIKDRKKEKNTETNIERER